METVSTPPAFEKISPTAAMTALQRAFSDIPFAGEIAADEKVQALAGGLADSDTGAAGVFARAALEIRYKAINHALQEGGFNHVLEIACGFSSRGLEIASAGGRYVGTDLQRLGNVAFPVLRRIAFREGIAADNLRYQTANALEEGALFRAAAFFRGHRFAICHEGLLPYFSPEEKALLAAHIRKVLLPTRGVWITTDIAYHELIFELMKAWAPGAALTEEARQRFDKVKAVTGRDFHQNLFSDVAEATGFFERAGFVVESAPIDSGDFTLSTLPGSGPADQKATYAPLYAPRVWKLTPIPFPG